MYISIPPTTPPKKQPHHLFLHNNKPDNISNISIIHTTGVVSIEVKKAKYTKEVLATLAGYITEINAEGYGVASLMLGAGRNTKEDKIDHLAGIVLNKKVGDYVNVGDVLAVMHASNEKLFDGAIKTYLDSTKIGNEKPKEIPLLYGKVE